MAPTKDWPLDNSKILFGPFESIECMYDFWKKSKSYIIDKEILKSGVTHLVNSLVQIFTDGSRLNGTFRCRQIMFRILDRILAVAKV